MTETAQQSQQAEQEAQGAAQGAAAEAENLAEQERKRKQRELEDAAYLKRKQQHEDYVARFGDKDVTKFSTAETLQQLFGSDTGAVEFLVGVMNVEGVAQNKKAPNVFELKTVGGNVVSFIKSQDGGEFFGLTAKQAKNTPMTDALADDIMVSIQATGKTHITLVGSITDKEIMWQAAQDHGLVVVGFTPRQEIIDAYKARQENAPAAGAHTAQPEGEAPAAGAQAAQPESEAPAAGAQIAEAEAEAPSGFMKKKAATEAKDDKVSQFVKGGEKAEYREGLEGLLSTPAKAAANKDNTVTTPKQKR